MINLKSIVYSKLLCFGYIPETITNLLSSESFGKFILKHNEEIQTPHDRNITLEICSIKLTRNNNTPRYLGIIHPYAYLSLSRTIIESWRSICKTVFNSSSLRKNRVISAIKPRFDNEIGRMIAIFNTKSYEIKEIDDYSNTIQALNEKLEATILVKADISNFYHSIYTHSVPWAAIGRDKSYSDRDTSNWYNKIDKALRFCQMNETIGLPIGSDTSAIIAEFILSKIDTALNQYSYVRYIDDYFCFCSSNEEAESFLGNLSSELEKYRLHLNVKKTELIPLPSPLSPLWISTLRHYDRSCPKSINQSNFSQIEDMINTIVILAKEYPHESPIKFGFKMIFSKTFEDYEVYSNTLKYILHIGVLYPYIIPEYEKFINYGYENFNKDKSKISILLQNFINKIIEKHSPFRRTDALSWAVQYARKYKINIPKKNILMIIAAKDPVSSLFAYLYVEEYKKPWKKIFPKIDDHNTSWWLYTYEIHRLSNTKYAQNKRKDYQFLNLLLENNITFIKEIKT